MSKPTAEEQTPLLGNSSNPDLPTSHNTNTRQPGNESNVDRFRSAIGIDSPLYSANGDLESARKGARGLYKEIIDIQRWASRQYQFVEILYYVALGAQVIIGASLAALGPISKLHSTSITVLGVVNASTAGVLALLKGQGLPDRLRKDEFEMRKVQDYIEEVEIKLAITGDDLTKEELKKIVDQVFEKYNTARDTCEMNKPSSYARQAPSEAQQTDGGEEVPVRNNLLSNGKGKSAGKYIIE
ncbi:hypothetical protein G7Y89_g2559 [Cudoniella acicularis]|uniref:SMODS and SLOG-associating 2TM effector domain-containing protein n=1 Tax=Cudoniella acicularis TaxID=354080 RepID=A0A8H4RT33_9HELO|nr:hypothetical protein G7Y89_g2559 [Cudoniella acicularis]